MLFSYYVKRTANPISTQAMQTHSLMRSPAGKVVLEIKLSCFQAWSFSPILAAFQNSPLKLEKGKDLSNCKLQRKEGLERLTQCDESLERASSV
jgi:hypothetical protein